MDFGGRKREGRACEGSKIVLIEFECFPGVRAQAETRGVVEVVEMDSNITVVC